MAAGLLSIFLWALFEEIVKVTGVRLAMGTIFSIPSRVWFFAVEVALKTFWLTETFEFSDDEALRVYAGAAFLSAASSVIHLYTCIFYGAASNVAYALAVCTLLHTTFNVYAAHGMKTVLVDPTYNHVLVAAWIMSSIFGMALLLAFMLERRFLKA
ncbi:hypothetical protein [Ensifer sp.]|jgi:hypothetical protein|uniref:hypothetical protein n=1 Tax=Ensifer sp. TaxID=1872086 RepID=UPI002E0E7D71|nr:hypothetical protein [Ensifer sp.]